MTKNGKDVHEGGRKPVKKTSGKKPVAKKAVNKEPGKREQAKKKRKRIVFFTLEIAVLIVMVIVLWGVLKGGEAGHLIIPEEDIVINETVKEAETTTMLGYRNIALFGVDSTKGSLGKGTRSDSIMIASIDQDTGDCKLVSVYRDTYLNLSNDSYNKCNAAYAKGGPEMAINMLNMNLDLNITDFVTVGFNGLTDTIDALGGVYIDVESGEIRHLNNYQLTMSQDMKRNNYTEVTSPGYQLLDGLQATAYCRIRYYGSGIYGDGDFRRAERQRTVLEATADQARKASPASLGKIADSVFGEVYTSLSLEEIVGLLADVTKYEITETAGFPAVEYRGGVKDMGGKGDCVIPVSLEDNVKWLHEFLFGVKDYEPSDTVKECSKKIEADYLKYK